MANEITLSVYGQVVNGNFTSRFQPGNVQITQTTLGSHAPIVVVGTSEEDMSFGDIGTVGIVAMRNLDSTNYVQYGPKSGGVMVAFGRLKAGEVAVFRMDSAVTMRWVANTASCKVQVWALET